MPIRYCKVQKAKSTGKPCRARAVNGKDVCYHHGGATPRGIASPHYKDGSCTPWDEILPKDLALTFRNAYTDPKLLSLRKDIALTEARETQLLAELTSENSAATWGQLDAARADYLAAQDAKNFGKAADALASIMALITHGAADIRKWAELRNVQEHKRKLTETEWKSKTALAKVLTMEQFGQLLDALRSAVITEVSDKRQAQAVIDKVRCIVEANRILGDDEPSS